MSRHRSTLKMHRVKDKHAARTAGTEGTANEGKGADEANDAGDGLSTRGGPTTETLGRYLAAEISLRESGEERGAAALARYFKLTLVMAGLNMVVASASLIMVFSRSSKPQTIVVNPPMPSYVAPAPQAPPAAKVAAVPAPASPAQPPAPALPPAPSPPAKLPLLGQPPSAPARIPLLGRPAAARVRSLATSPSQAPRPSIPKPQPSDPVFAKNVAEEETPLPVVSQATERW